MNKTQIKKEKPFSVINIIIYSALLLLIGAVIFYDVYSRCKRGWNNDDTIQVVFLGFVLITGIYMSKSFIDYFVSKSRDVLFLNNDIYRLFKQLEDDGRLKEYEEKIITNEINNYLKRINAILQKKKKEVLVTKENIDQFFNEKYEIYIGDTDVNIIYQSILDSSYRKIKKHKSIRFEKLYSSVNSGELIKEKRFPLFELILPLLFGVMGVFATIYQGLSIDGSIKEPIIQYLTLFGITFVYSILIAFFETKSFKEVMITRKRNILEELQSFDLKK